MKKKVKFSVIPYWCVMISVPLLGVLCCPGVSAAEDMNVLGRARETAEIWLQLVDSGKYGECWDRASPLLKAHMKRDDWVQALAQGEKEYGRAAQRTLKGDSLEESPPNMPKGQYAALVFETAFENKTAEECVVLRNEDGDWRVLGYWLQ